MSSGSSLNSQILSLRDGIAVAVAAAFGVTFAYLSARAGFGWIVAAGPYVIVVIPCVVAFLADQRKLLVWQVCILSFVLYILANNWGMRWKDAVTMVYVVWALGTILSSPVPAYFYLRRFRGRKLLAAIISAIAVLASMYALIGLISGRWSW